MRVSMTQDIKGLSRHSLWQHILSNWYDILPWGIYQYLFGYTSSQQLTTLIERSASRTLLSTCRGSFRIIEVSAGGAPLLLTLVCKGKLSQQYISACHARCLGLFAVSAVSSTYNYPIPRAQDVFFLKKKKYRKFRLLFNRHMGPYDHKSPQSTVMCIAGTNH